MPISDPPSLAAVFSTAVIKALAGAEIGPAARRVTRLLEPNDPPSITLASAFEMAHARLLATYPNEYTFKNQIVSKIVLGRHSLNTASALLEQPMGSSIADVFVLNGTSTVYEVKTDFDSFARLGTQLDDYRRHAEFVYVVVSERRAGAASEIAPMGVGILALRRHGSLSIVRPASSNLSLLQHEDLFRLLRTHEAVSLVRELTGHSLDLPSGHLRSAAFELYKELTREQAHTEVVRALKGRSINARRLLASASFPVSLRALAYATELPAVGAARLQERLSRPIGQLTSAI